MNALPQPPDPWLSARLAMVEQQLGRRGVKDERVLAALARVPRHEFVPPAFRDSAYEDRPLSIGEGQTISQPYVVASTVEAAEIQPADVVLEVGTGSGYQTAVLAELAAEVFSVERFASLAESAQRLLAHLNYANIVIQMGDGSVGLPSAAPFDAIVVAAAAPRVPEALVAQLREGGRLVVPVGDTYEQTLIQVRKQDGRPHTRQLYPCRFVPLIGEQGFRA